MYQPKPINTSNIVLPDELMKLSEKLAANVHDVWAKSRIEEGWVCGEIKDSNKKTTLCLVPYDELPEAEKAYDRNTVIETLKLVQKFGYVITNK